MRGRMVKCATGDAKTFAAAAYKAAREIALQDFMGSVIQEAVRRSPACQMASLLLQRDGIGEQERQKLAAEAHKAARAVGLQEIMAANESGGVTRDSLRKGNPLAVKVSPLQSLHAQDSWRIFPLPCGIKDGQGSPQSCQSITASIESRYGVGGSLTTGNPQCCPAVELLTCKSLKHYTNCFESS